MVSERTDTGGIRPGDQVLTPEGSGGPVALVLEVYGPRQRKQAFVRVFIQGPNGETVAEYETTIEMDLLRRIDAA
jgi:hypothetical protein